MTYYNQPMLKRPVWIWSVPVYFYVGGITGAATVLGAAAQIADRQGFEGLIRKCRWIGATGYGLSAFLLIVDLGRPERFLNMLRTINFSSPLSVGSWVLTIGGAFSMASVILPGRGGDAAGLGAGSMGIPLAGYTGVLLANTAIPVWQRARKTLPVLSIASSAAAAASIFETMTLLPHEKRAVTRFGIMGKTAELAAISTLPKPKSGLSFALLTAAGILTAGSLVLSLFPHKKAAMTRAAGIAGTLGAIALRFSVFYAGFSSEERLAGTSHSESRNPDNHSMH